MTDAEIIEEIMDMLNGSDSPTSVHAYRDGILDELQNVLDICMDRKKQLDEIQDFMGDYSYR